MQGVGCEAGVLGDTQFAVGSVDIADLLPRALHDRLLVFLHDARAEAAHDPVDRPDVELAKPVRVA